MRTKLVSVIDSITLAKAISSWFIITFAFGIIYYLLTFTHTHTMLVNGQELSSGIIGLGNSVYFSFITATTLGYGNITPLGFSKVLAILEVIMSLSLFGIIIAKLVSIKQEELLEEIQELSFEEESNDALSTLYLVRNDFRTINDGVVKKVDLKLFEHSINSLNVSLHTLQHANARIATEDTEAKALHMELIANSITFSLSKLVELTEKFNNKKIAWKKDSITATMQETYRLSKGVYEQYAALNTDGKSKVAEKLADLNLALTNLEKSCKP